MIQHTFTHLCVFVGFGTVSRRAEMIWSEM